METKNPKLALCDSKNECARTDTVFFPISEVSASTVSLSLTFFLYFLLLFSFPYFTLKLGDSWSIPGIGPVCSEYSDIRIYSNIY